jgi:hypothetical protein
MADFPLDGILHLSALVVIVTIGYVGIDRIHTPEVTLEAEISIVIERVNILLALYEAHIENGRVNTFIYDIPALYVLCRVAGKKLTYPWYLCWKRFFHAFYRFWSFPLLWYFRKNKDAYIVYAFCFVSTLIFLSLVAARIFDLSGYINNQVIKVIYWVNAVTLVWIMVSVTASHKLRKMGIVCNNLEMKLKARTDTIANVFLDIAAAPPANGAAP